MADEISELRFFVLVAAAGSLSAAGRQLDSSPAAMSRRLAALEGRLGVRLVSRTTRSFELTAEGNLFHERCLRIIAEIDEAEAEAAAGNTNPSGPLRVGVPLEIGRRRFAPLIADFVGLYPNVEATLVLSDAGLDVVDDHLDVSLCVGLPTDQDLVATKILSSDLVICAAPDYLQRHGAPVHPRDVLAHNCIRFVRGYRHLDRWSFKVEGERQELRIRGNLITTSAEVVHDWALSGRGLARKPLWDVQGDIDSGRLVECLTAFRDAELTLYAVHVQRRYLAPRVRLFIEFIKASLDHPRDPAPARPHRDGPAARRKT